LMCPTSGFVFLRYFYDVNLKAITLLCGFSLFLIACGGDGAGGGKGGYRATLVFPEQVPRTETAGIDCEAAQIETIDFTFSVNDSPYSTYSVACKEHLASIGNIASGRNIRVDVYANNAAAELLYFGSEETVIESGKVTTGGEIEMTPIDSSEISETDPDPDPDPDPGTAADRFTVDYLGMEFVRIPAGTFLMGSPETEYGREREEVQHWVTLTQPYYIQTTEVTQRQWMTVMGANTNPSRFVACGPECPVESVSFEDIQNFIARLNSLGHGTYRLPTEAEWEYAARGGQETAFCNGDITQSECYPLDETLNAVGWYCGNVDVDYEYPYDDSANGGPVRGGTHPVAAEKAPNQYGLYDMHGNVWEWCRDWYGPYPTEAVSNPTGAPASSSQTRVIRGGSWRNEAWRCRSAHRGDNYPDRRSPSGGFRLICTRAPE